MKNLNETEEFSDAGLNALLRCPFCGCKMDIFSNRDWHHLQGDHDEFCLFVPIPESTATVPATDEQRAALVHDWNRRYNLNVCNYDGA